MHIDDEYTKLPANCQDFPDIYEPFCCTNGFYGPFSILFCVALAVKFGSAERHHVVQSVQIVEYFRWFSPSGHHCWL